MHAVSWTPPVLAAAIATSVVAAARIATRPPSPWTHGRSCVGFVPPALPPPGISPQQPIAAPVDRRCATEVRAFLQDEVDWTFHQSRPYAPREWTCESDREAFDAMYRIGSDPWAPAALAYLALLHANDYDGVANHGARDAELHRRLANVSIAAAVDYLAADIERDAAYALNGVEASDVDDPDRLADVSRAFDARYPRSTYRFEHAR